ncbi:MAG: hypothetical protein FRX49_08721 [Trebouxia sp. A1-2]|nr:MAG: hypothetical protein FRX49_08721 [Trebouxia sp. A1-2]
MCIRTDAQEGTAVSADLGIEEHVLANGQAQRVLRCLKGKSEEPGVVRQGDLLRQLEWNLLLWIECNLGGRVAATAHSKLSLVTHLLLVTYGVLSLLVSTLVLATACFSVTAAMPPLAMASLSIHPPGSPPLLVGCSQYRHSCPSRLALGCILMRKKSCAIDQGGAI